MNSRLIFSIGAIFLMAFALQAQSLPPRQPERVVVLSPGAAWNKDVTWAAQAGIDAHADYYKKALGDGKIQSFGPKIDGQGAVVTPSPRLSTNEVRNLALQDPAVKSGLLKAEVIEWTIAAGQLPSSSPASRGISQQQEVEKEKKSFPRSAGKNASGRSKPPAFE